MQKENKFISLVVYLHNVEDYIEYYLDKVLPVCDNHFQEFEIVCVDDGCSDDTMKVLKEYIEKNQIKAMVNVIHMSFFQGLESAMNAGRDIAIGDFVYEFDDVFVYAPVPAVVELGDEILGFDGCLNFFAGPLDQKFSAKFNFYNVHYKQHHVSGTSGSTMEDMQDIVRLIGEGKINPAVMITHIGGIDAAIDTTLHLPQIHGGKKLIYTHINLPLTAIADFAALGETDGRFKTLDMLVKKNNGLWSAEAEAYLLEHF